MTGRSSTPVFTAGGAASRMTASEWLENVRALDLDMIARYGVKAGKGKNGVEAVALPYRRNGELVAHKVRRVGDRATIAAAGLEPFWWSGSGGGQMLFNADALDDTTMAAQPIIVTEGEFDCLSVVQSGFPRCVSISDGWSGQGGAKAKPLVDAEAKLRKSPCVIVAGDNDPTGRLFVRAMWNIVEGHPVRYVEWPEGCKDANETLAKYGEGEVARCINAAKFMDPPGGVICGFSDAPPAPEGRVLVTGDDTADRAFCCHAGFMTVVTGTPSAGKSTWLTWALARMAQHESVRVGVCLMETPWPVLRDHLARMSTGGRTWAQLAGIEQDALAEQLDASWRLMLREDNDDAPGDMGWIRDMLRTAATRDGCSVIAFDPWNEIEHRLNPGESVTDYTNAALAKLRQWSERYGVATVVVAHPTKMNGEAGAKPRPPLGYDISGSSAWFNKAAVGVTIHREEDDYGEHTVVINWKTKFEQLYPCRKGKVRMAFDHQSMVFGRMM